jgi:two-component system, chemotaxis family, protein-glutamate methylesterase/glutaminase
MTAPLLHGREIAAIAIGASAGGIEALTTLVRGLPADFPAAVLVVLHLAPAGTSVLPQILARAGLLPAETAVDGTPIAGGHIYVAPPDCHLTVEDGRLGVRRGPHVNGHRPAVDALFRTAAHAHGTGVAGVVLSGVLDDGAAGLAAIKAHGGKTLVQDPADALYDGMPRTAIEAADPDVVCSAAELAAALVELAAAPPPMPPSEGIAPGETFLEVDQGATDQPHNGAPTGYSCPACNGGIWESTENGREVYRCRIGHEYGVETFVAEQADEVERALWTALRSIEERAALHRRLADRLSHRGSGGTASRFAQRADESIQEAVALRELLERYEMGRGELP